MPTFADNEQCNLVIIGESLVSRMHNAADNLPNIKLSAGFGRIEDFEAASDTLEADILVIEQPTLSPDTASRLASWVARVNAKHAIVIYRYASQEALSKLPRSKSSTLLAPVKPESLQSFCMAVVGRSIGRDQLDSESALLATEPAPPRRYTDETLSRLAALSPAVRCECPRHLAELIASLSAFEQYSTECESVSPKDAALHAYLNAATSHARHMIETALSHVIEAENIEV
jgi:hypothetical protein